MRNGMRNGKWIVFAALLLFAGAFRIAVAHWLANDNPDDSRVYSLIARNIVEQHSYSQAEEFPYEPTLIRAPGYPLFLAGIYSVFGHTNNGAVRFVQALIDTGTCALVAFLGWFWQPNKTLKRMTAIVALALAAINPFTTIYCATILTEVPTVFVVVATCIAATIAFRGTLTRESTEKIARRPLLNRALLWWTTAGLLAGVAVLIRPDSGLIAIAICLTIVITGFVRFKARWRAHLAACVIFGASLTLTLVPWTIRNWRVFHLFQPLAPVHAEMPEEFVPLGYARWLKTWLDDQRYVEDFWWPLDVAPMDVDDLPDSAFDSADERTRVAALLDRYNHPTNAQATSQSPGFQSQPSPSPSPTRPNDQTRANSNPNANAGNTDEDENDNSADENDNSDEDNSEKPETEEHTPVRMTAEIDAAFGQIAAERIAHHPLRYYVWTPAKRASSLWFNTHSDFYPFAGQLIPLGDLHYDAHQQTSM